MTNWKRTLPPRRWLERSGDINRPVTDHRQSRSTTFTGGPNEKPSLLIRTSLADSVSQLPPKMTGFSGKFPAGLADGFSTQLMQRQQQFPSPRLMKNGLGTRKNASAEIEMSGGFGGSQFAALPTAWPVCVGATVRIRHRCAAAAVTTRIDSVVPTNCIQAHAQSEKCDSDEIAHREKSDAPSISPPCSIAPAASCLGTQIRQFSSNEPPASCV